MNTKKRTVFRSISLSFLLLSFNSLLYEIEAWPFCSSTWLNFILILCHTQNKTKNFFFLGFNSKIDLFDEMKWIAFLVKKQQQNIHTHINRIQSKWNEKVFLRIEFHELWPKYHHFTISQYIYTLVLRHTLILRVLNFSIINKCETSRPFFDRWRFSTLTSLHAFSSFCWWLLLSFNYKWHLVSYEILYFGRVVSFNLVLSFSVFLVLSFSIWLQAFVFVFHAFLFLFTWCVYTFIFYCRFHCILGKFCYFLFGYREFFFLLQNTFDALLILNGICVHVCMSVGCFQFNTFNWEREWSRLNDEVWLTTNTKGYQTKSKCKMRRKRRRWKNTNCLANALAYHIKCWLFVESSTAARTISSRMLYYCNIQSE